MSKVRNPETQRFEEIITKKEKTKEEKKEETKEETPVATVEKKTK